MDRSDRHFTHLSKETKKENYQWKIECFLEDLFLGGQSSIILGYRRLSVKSLLVCDLGLLSMVMLIWVYISKHLASYVLINLLFKVFPYVEKVFISE